MTDGSGAGNLFEAASSGVEGLASAVTPVLGQAGPVGALIQPVVDVLRYVWGEYFASPIPQGGTNWNAYTHEQLYQMLWQGADVGDVSAVAAEWGRHSAALTSHADALRDQRAALQSNWQGRAAEPAARRLGELGDRISGIGVRADTVEQAAQDAGDALALARNTMPPPPGDPTRLAASATVAGAGVGAAIGAVVGAGMGGVGAGPGTVMGAAIGAVAAGGASLFLASVAAEEKKAEAVHVMQRYESSLRNSSQTISPVPPDTTDARTYSVDGTRGTDGARGADGAATGLAGYLGGGGPRGDGSLRGGVSWRRLVGGTLGPGVAVGVGSGAMDGGLTAKGGALSELAAGRAAGAGGMWPPGAGARGHGDEDEQHRNRMPAIDQRLFAVDERAGIPVIGL